MTSSARHVLLLLPVPRDAELTADVLGKNGIMTRVCDSPAMLGAEIARGAAAVLVAEESLATGAQSLLVQTVDLQPRWSDLPVLVLTRRGADSESVSNAVAQLGNVTLLERPLRLATLLSAVHSALRARERQYQIRTHLEDLERAREAVAQTVRHKDEFLAMLGHELRNPLAPIRNALHLLGAGDRHSVEEEGLRAMLERQVNHMVRLVDDLVDVSRLSRGTIELRRERVDIEEILRNAVDLSRPLVTAGRHSLVLDLATEPLVVHADPVRIAQVFGNLLNNAAKYAQPEGQIIVTAHREGDEVVLMVRDRGIGIEPEMLPHVFELFTQGRREAHRAQDGLGIGLTLVRSLVQMHGGSVSAASDGLGRGSVFTVRLPLAADIAPGSHDPETAEPAVTARTGGRLRVLVVDDNADAAKSLGMVLEMLDIDHAVEFNGPDALATAAAFHPDVVLLDIGMPGMDGYEVARSLRMDPASRKATLVAVTGWSQVRDQQRTRASGFDHHLSKPVDLGELQRLLQTLAQAEASEACDSDAA